MSDYFADDYFPADFFAADFFGGAAGPAPTPGIGGYYPGDYYPSDYFPGDAFPGTGLPSPVLVGPTGWPTLAFLVLQSGPTSLTPLPPDGPPIADAARPRAEDAYLDLQARLRALTDDAGLPLFSDVVLGSSMEDLPEPAANMVNAVVWPRSFGLDPSGDDQEMTWTEDEHRFGIGVELNLAHAPNRALRLLWLARIVQAINGKDLGGVCEPSRTLVLRGAFRDENWPNAALELEGRFVVRTIGVSNVDPTPVWVPW